MNDEPWNDRLVTIFYYEYTHITSKYILARKGLATWFSRREEKDSTAGR
ncbi:UNVERIFIED_CONTAM: hypothetical protein ABIC26_004645 [Paenibacillus sp. PvR008]